MRKQFDLEYYKAHPETKVVTREGRSVRIICTNAMSSEETNKIVGLIRLVDYEGVQIFYPNGLVFKNSQHCYDLFFELPDPEKKKVPLTYEDLLERVKDGKNMWVLFKNGSNFLIISFDKEGITVVDGGINHKKTCLFKYANLAFAKAHFADGTPCWKEE